MPLLLLAYLGFVSVGLPDGMLGVAWPHMRAEFDEPVGAVGFLLFTFTAGYVVSGVLAGFVIGRLGVGRLLAGSTALAAAALAGFALAPGLAVVVGVAGFLGLSSGAIDAALNAFAARHYGARHMNWLHASYSFGATLGPLVVTGAVAAGLAWRGGYGVVAAGQLLLATAFVLTVRAWRDGAPPVRAAAPPAGVPAAPAAAAEVPTGVPTEASAPAGTGPPATPGATPAVTRLGGTLALAATWLGAAAFGVYVAVEIGAGLWAYTLLTEGRGISGRLAGVAVSAYWASLFVGRLLIGVLGERVGVHRVLSASVAGISAGAVLVALPAPGWLAVVGLMLVGLASAPVFPLLMLTTAERVGDGHADRAIGLQVGAAAVGGTALPAGIGVLIDRLGPAVLGPSLLVLGLALAAIYLAAHPVRRPSREQRWGRPDAGTPPPRS